MNPDLISRTWPDSLWNATAIPLAPLPVLQNVTETRVGIVGGGYTGLSTALHLAERGVESIVMERNQPGWGCSGRNGGQINPNWKILPDPLRMHIEPDRMKDLIQMMNTTCDLVFELIARYGMDCHTIRPGYLLGVIGKPGRQYMDRWVTQWRIPPERAQILQRERLAELLGTNHYDCGMLDRCGGSLQPLSYARELARVCLTQGVTLHGDTPALRVQRRGAGWRIHTSEGAVDCATVVIATNGYTDPLWPGLRQNIVPVGSLISATEPLPSDVTNQITPQRHAVSDMAGLPIYYRIDEAGRMVFGGRSTIFGRIGSHDTRALRKMACRMYPMLRDFHWEYDWGGYVAMTSHQRPLMLQLEEQVYAGLGYNGRGVAMATMMGKQLAQQITEGWAALPLESPRAIPLHGLYPIGIAGRMVAGYLRDRLLPGIRD